MPLLRAVLERRRGDRWVAYFYIAEREPRAIGQTEGTWAHCIGELLKLREGMVAKGKR